MPCAFIMHLRRFATVATLAVWWGGFAFYSGIVLPILHISMTSPEAGRITQQVTVKLNLLGIAALGCLLLTTHRDRRLGSPRAQSARLAALAVNVVLLWALCTLHQRMDHHLAAVGLTDFYPQHRLYLILSTIAWFAQLSALALWLRAWSGSQTPDVQS